jgi:hypothetical protein
VDKEINEKKKKNETRRSIEGEDEEKDEKEREID